jgi:hypothetical protein
MDAVRQYQARSVEVWRRYCIDAQQISFHYLFSVDHVHDNTALEA